MKWDLLDWFGQHVKCLKKCFVWRKLLAWSQICNTMSKRFHWCSLIWSLTFLFSKISDFIFRTAFKCLKTVKIYNFLGYWELNWTIQKKLNLFHFILFFLFIWTNKNRHKPEDKHESISKKSKREETPFNASGRPRLSKRELNDLVKKRKWKKKEKQIKIKTNRNWTQN